MKKIINKILVLLLTCIIFVGSIYTFNIVSYASSDIDLDSIEDKTWYNTLVEVLYEAGYNISYLTGNSDTFQSILNDIMSGFGYETYDEELLDEVMSLNMSIENLNVTLSESLYNALMSAADYYLEESTLNLDDYLLGYYPYDGIANTATYYPTVFDADLISDNYLAVQSFAWYLDNYPDEIQSILNSISDCDYLWWHFGECYGYTYDDSGNKILGFCISYIPQDIVNNNTVVCINYGNYKSSYSMNFYLYDSSYFTFSQCPFNYVTFLLDEHNNNYLGGNLDILGISSVDDISSYNFYYSSDCLTIPTGNTAYSCNSAINIFFTSRYYSDTASFYGRGRWAVFDSQKAYAELVTDYGISSLYYGSLNDDGSYTIYNYYTTINNYGSDDSADVDYTETLENITSQLDEMIEYLKTLAENDYSEDLEDILSQLDEVIEYLEILSDKEEIDYSDDFSDLNDKLSDVLDYLKELEKKEDYEIDYSDDLQDIINYLEELAGKEDIDYSEDLQDIIDYLEELAGKEDIDYSEDLQSIIDYLEELAGKEDVDYSEDLADIIDYLKELADIEVVDYSDDLKDISNQLDDLISYMKDLSKIDLTDYTSELDDINESLEDIKKYLKELSEKEDIDYSDDLDDFSSQFDKMLDYLEDINDKLLYSNILDTIDDVLDWYDELSDSETATALSALEDTVKSAFPFSVVTDIGLIAGLFVADPVIPVFTIPIDFTSINKNWYYEFVIDFGDFQTLANIVKAFMLLIWIVGLIKMTPKFINNGGSD